MMAMSGPGPVPVRATVLNRLHPSMVLAGFFAAVLADLLGGWLVAVLLAVLACSGLAVAGWRPGHLGGLLRPWLPIALLVLVIHILTTTSAAPLGHPSLTGLGRGLAALTRLAGILMGLALLQGVLEVDDLVSGLAWWLRPLDGRLVPVRDLGLMMAVALGTAPRVLSEGRRLQGVIRLRRGGREPRIVQRFSRRVRDQVAVVVPLLEGMARRAETISLTLRLRRPGTGTPLSTVGPRQGFLLAGWVFLLAGLVLLPGRML